ncbi:TIR domain-containing protein [Pectobacterium parmentieri]|uniref:TIR domain-containing protein n=1 Tax=Pectobacterium parmentieri TaxID=1905730 RepID=UPI000EB14C34|nr:TIR domain-containing protein [Pectobacterium parmentieri]AYH00933.1 TIR domain-containing protein [Pectobacterium parmentieri]
MTSENISKTENKEKAEIPKAINPLVFISHDTRDAEIAEAFSKLIGSVSAGVLKSFRSSDRKGAQGIEYGVEWYPTIMGQLNNASDVVCLLTPMSLERPWILYEAGVARGKLNTPVHGVAIGVPLSKAATGPFAQFQNCGDDEESLTSLVMQLVDRIPNSEPDRDVVKFQVAAFKTKIEVILAARDESSQGSTIDEVEENNVVKMFEEVKVMFQDLPRHIERRLDPEIREEGFIRHSKRFRLHPKYIDELCYIVGKGEDDPIFLLIIGSELSSTFPWFYELAKRAYDALVSKAKNSHEIVRSMMKTLGFITHGPGVKMLGYSSARQREDMRELMMYLEHRLSRFV